MVQTKLEQIKGDQSLILQAENGIHISEYILCLPPEAKNKYKEKPSALKCSVDPYIDTFDSWCPLPPVTYTDIYDYLVNSHSVH